MTVQELINRALRDIGVIATGETASASELSDSFQTFQDLIAEWALTPKSYFPDGIAVPEYTVVTDDLGLPEGYQKALRYTLAEQLCDSFAIPVPKSIAVIGKHSRRVIKRSNLVLENQELPYFSIYADIVNDG